jgi:ubiquinone/menaquinone biosynthesis C-methylase UbiE
MKRRTRTFLRSALILVLLLAGMLACPPAARAAQNSGPARDAWNHPEAVMDALGVHSGSAVADIGCGRGYFTFKFAARVGREGKVFAEDLREDELASIRRRAEHDGLSQIETVLGSANDPRLPAQSVDAVLVMNSYHEFADHDAILAGIMRALKPGGLLALIDGVAEDGHPRDYYDGTHRLPERFECEEAERAGLRLLRREPGFTDPEKNKEFYFLILQKPKP